MIEVVLVKAGMTMKEGVVAEWYVPDGGEVHQGEPLYRMETEKIDLEVEAEDSGTVRHAVPAGTTLAPGALIGYILAPGEVLPESPGVASAAPEMPAPSSARTPADASGPRFASPIARRLAREAGIDLSAVAGSGPSGRVVEADVLAAKARPPQPRAQAAPEPAAEAAAASPIARRLAQQLGVDLRGVRGTGPGGRITKEDVEAVAQSQLPLPSAAIPLRGMRKVIAERMHSSLQEMAQLTMGMEVRMTEAASLRQQLGDEWAAEGVRPSYTDLVVRAVAKALTLHPGLNATVTDTEIRLLPEIHIGMAVALDTGLVVPVVRDAGSLSLHELAITTRRLAEAARAGQLGLDDMAGGTFSITTLGMAGIDFFTPIINPPNVAILGVGRVHDGLSWDGDRPVRQQVMTLSLTVDHRAVDGTPGAAFLNTVRELLESPYRLLV